MCDNTPPQKSSEYLHFFMDWSGRLLDSRGNSETGEPLHGGSGSALAHRKASSLQRKSFFTFHINSMDGFVFQHYESLTQIALGFTICSKQLRIILID